MQHISGERLGEVPRRLWAYSPHRAIVVLGVLLMAVAVGSGVLGVVNSGRAETSATTVGERYVVLLTPVRDMQAAVSGFQIVAQQSFSDASSTPALLTEALAESTATDQAYLTVQRLLAAADDASLAPGLAAQVRAYQASRTALATLLASKSQTLQDLKIATTEERQDKNLDAALATLQSTVTTRLIQTNDQARNDARVARDDLLWCLAIGFPFGILITVLFARKALRAERIAASRDAAQARITERSEFEGRLQRALEMAKAEVPAFDMVAQALGDAAPGMYSELLLADSSRAHFRQVLASEADADQPGCGVVSPNDCPAASRGQTMVFPFSTALDACPNLRGRGCSALCVPVSIGGNSVGVVHVTTREGSPPGEAVRRDVEVVARRASERFAMIRAFDASQTQANSDSLTGLLTRRSLESRIRELNEGGSQYTVAYGDLDHFKQLNDVFGHSAGDRALRAFSQVLRDALRPSDIACRYGGEEFVIILPACPIDEAVAVLGRVMHRLADRLTAGRLPAFTVSFGVASSDQAPDFDQVVVLADEALLQAKVAGRDRIIVAGETQSKGGQASPIVDERGPTTPLGSRPSSTGSNPSPHLATIGHAANGGGVVP